MIDRRSVALGGPAWCAAMGMPAVAARPTRIGVLMFAPDTASFQSAFRLGLRELGYVEGHDVVVEWRSAAGQPALAVQHADDLVRQRVAVIVAEFTPAAVAARKATATIPIVMAPAGDPVGSGLVSTLARPGGNVTGHTNIVAELAGKRLELLQAMRPGLAQVGLLVSGTDPLEQRLVSTARQAAQRVSVQLHLADLKNPADVETAFDELTRRRCGGVIVPGNLPAPLQHTAQAALRRRMASISLISNFPEVGGLAFYGANLADIQRRAAATVDQLLKGARAADLPVQQPTLFDLVLNLATARALGIEVPQAVRLQTTKVIE